MSDGIFDIPNTTIIKATVKAILIKSPELKKEEWVPLSAIHDNSEIWKKGETGTLLVKSWFAEKKVWD